MQQLRRYFLTAVIVLIAAVVVLAKYWDYLANPWTRDGQVRADVIQLTPRVSGPIVNLPIKDNQLVKAGDLLFEIDPRTFESALAQARAQYDQTGDNYLALQKQVEAARAAVSQAQSAIKEVESVIERNQSEYQRQLDMLPNNATSRKAVEGAKANYEVALERRKGADAALSQARAALARAEANLGAQGDANPQIRSARAAVRQAELNLEFTRLRAPVDGYVTNLNLRLGSHATANQPALALVDVKSFWVSGFFRETVIEHIRPGDKALITLMAFPDKPLKGTVDSLGWGISQKDGSTGFELLPNVSPSFDWIRLAQRIPVRIHLDEIPKGVSLRVGITASVLVRTNTADSGK